MKRTFVDSGVLILAARGTSSDSERALEVLEESDREFISSAFIRLEVLPKATYHKKSKELEFYEAFFDSVVAWTDDLHELLETAHQIACTYGLASLDALHISAAILLNAEEFITTEKATKPMYRVPSLRCVSI